MDDDSAAPQFHELLRDDPSPGAAGVPTVADPGDKPGHNAPECRSTRPGRRRAGTLAGRRWAALVRRHRAARRWAEGGPLSLHWREQRTHTAPLDTRLTLASASSLKRARRLWAVAPVVLICAGTAGSVLAANTVARSDGMKARRAFATTSVEIASTLQLAILHEEDLVVSAQAFIASNPRATNAEFARWSSSMRAMQRYPELLVWGEPVIVPAGKLAAFAASARVDPTGPLGPASSFQVVPPGDRPYYCFNRLGEARSAADAAPAGFDFCAGALGAANLAARDSGKVSYLPLTIGATTSLGVETPVYRGGSVPSSVAARRAAFIGWVGMAIVPKVILDEALEGHPHMAVALRYDAGASAVVFRAGSAPPGATTRTIDLHNGWKVEAFGAVAGGGVLANSGALALLVALIALSVLLGALVYVLGTSRSRAVELVRERTDELRHQALHDALTGLPNRALILDRIDQMLARARRSRLAAAVLFIDLDDFKDINDTLGHHAGDELLAAVGARLAGAVRTGDTVGRLGGDEFVVLAEGTSLSAGVEVVAEKILEVLSTPFQLAGNNLPLHVTASIGIAAGDRARPEELLRDADIALYQAKAAGKQRAVVFAQAMHTAIEHRRQLEVDLHGALDAGQFFLLYQPTIDLRTNAFTGVEALLRWNHPERGVVSPDDFIPELEASGLIVAVGAWVLEEACRQGAVWHAAGYPFSISVNVSGRQLERHRIVDDVRSALEASGLDAGQLILELTETTLMDDVDATITRLGLLKALGVRLAVDDFGTGYSSLAYLRRFPIDVLKIDRSFVSGMADSDESAALVHTLVQLGKVLGLETIAEGVEDDDQRTRLRAEQVDTGQGFLFARPLDAEAVGRLLGRFPTSADAASRGVEEPSAPR